MSYIKIITILVIITVFMMEEAAARPRAQIVGNHIMKHQRGSDKRIVGNKTGKNRRHSKHIRRLRNRNLIKSLLAFEEEYEEQYDYDYESPIIEIRFKRDTTEEDVHTAFNTLKNKILEKDDLVQTFLHRNKNSFDLETVPPSVILLD